MATKDYYDILGIPVNATQQKIKKEYHFLLHAWHPDKFPDPDDKSRATQKTKELNDAYEVLGDPVKRTQYDQQRATESPSQPRPEPEAQRTQSHPPPDSTQSGPTPNNQASHQQQDRERQRRYEEARRYRDEQTKQTQTEKAKRARHQQFWQRDRLISLVYVSLVLVGLIVVSSTDILQRLFGSASRQAAFVPYATAVQTSALSSPSMTAFPTATDRPPTLTPTLAATQLVEAANDYKIELIPNDKMRVELVLKVSSDFPFQRQLFKLIPVVRDITDHWSVVDNRYDTWLKLDPQGFYFTDDQHQPGGGDGLEATNFILSGGSSAGDTSFVVGYWGDTSIQTTQNAGQDSYGLVIPVKVGMTTRVTLTLSTLEVGVTNAAGTQALIGADVSVHCPGKDVVGNVVDDEACRHGNGVYSHSTDNTGLTRFFVSPGTYFLTVSGGSYGDRKMQVNGITLALGEDKRTIVKYSFR